MGGLVPRHREANAADWRTQNRGCGAGDGGKPPRSEEAEAGAKREIPTRFASSRRCCLFCRMATASRDGARDSVWEGVPR